MTMPRTNTAAVTTTAGTAADTTPGPGAGREAAATRRAARSAVLVPVARGVGTKSPWLARRLMRWRGAPEAGMSTAEYAVGTIAACGFAAVLYKIVTSGPVRTALTGVIEKALHAPF